MYIHNLLNFAHFPSLSIVQLAVHIQMLLSQLRKEVSLRWLSCSSSGFAALLLYINHCEI